MNASTEINDLLVYACRSGKIQLVEERVAKGADVNYQDKDGITPILVAIKGSHLPIIEFLINKKAYLNCIDSYGNTPLEYAIEFDNKEIAQTLLNNGAYLGDKASPHAQEWLINFKRELKAKRS